MSFPIYYVICVICISKKNISKKYLKNEERESKTERQTYCVILSVVSNKTNLILGFSSPLIGHSEDKRVPIILIGESSWNVEVSLVS